MPDFPTAVRSIIWEPPVPNAYEVRSGYSARSTVIDRGGIKRGWYARVTVQPGSEAHARAWNAWTAQMVGPVGSADVVATETQQIASGALFDISTVLSATQFIAAGATALDPLTQGQMLTIYTAAGPANPWLVTLTQNTIVDGGGGRRLNFWPPLTGLSSGAAARILGRFPFARMRLDGPGPGWSVDPGTVYQPQTFNMVEIVP